MRRLHSTRSIFWSKLNTTATLLYKTEQQLTEDGHTLQALHSSLLRVKKESTLREFHQKLSEVATRLNYIPPKSADREVLLKRLNSYKRQNSFLRFAAIENACVHLCTVYEDLIRRILLKYYEEDVRRLKSSKESIKNDQLVDIILSSRNVHRALAEKAVDGVMYGSVEDWYRALAAIGMDIKPSQGVTEIFLVRNCLIHSDKKVSNQLSRAFPAKYRVWKSIRLTVKDFEEFKDSVEASATFIMSEYNRLFPENSGTWVGVEYE